MKNTLTAHIEPNHFDEEEIISRAQNGDAQAFNPLIRKYQRRIYNLIYQRVQNHEAAEDICQEVFLKAWRGIPNFQRKSVFYSWLHQIAVNCSIDYIRKQRQQIVFAYEELTINSDDTLNSDDILQIPQTHLSPPDLLAQEELGDIIRKSVAQLPPRQHTVFNLRYQEELSIKEIAIHLNLSVSSIKAHLYHARQKLQNMLQPYLKNEPFSVKELTS